MKFRLQTLFYMEGLDNPIFWGPNYSSEKFVVLERTYVSLRAVLNNRGTHFEITLFKI